MLPAQHVRFDAPQHVCIACGGHYYSREERINCPYCNAAEKDGGSLTWLIWVFIGIILVGMVYLAITVNGAPRPHSVLRNVTSSSAVPP